MPDLKEAVIVASRRSAVGRSHRGALRNTRSDDVAAQVIRATLADLPQLPLDTIDDVVMGCAMPEGEQGLNVARSIALDAGLPDGCAAMTINRFCASGLQSIASCGERIMVGAIDCAVAGGLESMSMVPMGGVKPMLNPRIVDTRPEIYISMGLTAENVARKYAISREAQDTFALRSHERARAAISEGRFKNEIIAVTTAEGRIFDVDEGPRADTTLDALAKLRPVFHAQGSVTAGNCSQTSDGAAATVMVSRERARQLDLTPIARFVGFAVAGVAPEFMGIGPIEAIPKVLQRTGLSLQDVDIIELNEAFASQSVAVIQQLGLDEDKVNVNGGAIALGHPLGCTGAKLTASLFSEMQRRKSRYGMVTMCIGGGMGAAGIFERM
ncbi:MAG: acetyl-CoA C-acyltransferase [Nannocystaceae bacterium]